MSDGITRRTAVRNGSLAAAAMLLGTGALTTDRARARGALPADAFSLGVASGDPLPDGVVLWTRLAPDPDAPDGRGGMPPERVRVRYEIAHDDRFRRIARRGTVVASPELAHAVHAEVHGLQPGREYFYRFEAAGQVSPVGRTKTAPDRRARLDALVLAFVSCQNYTAGYYTPYKHLAAEAVDVVLHLGDYQYEGPVDATAGARGVPTPPQHAVETTALEHYRLRYGLYKRDPDLQAAHASAPFVVTWDDHEVENNYAGAISENVGENPALFLQRRAAAYQAYYEHLPLRRSSVPRGPNLQLYRTVDYAGLARIHVIDSRQYRDDQVCGGGNASPQECTDLLDPSRTLLGAEQERWLLDSLRGSRATWNIIANQALMAEGDRDPSPDREFLSTDNWNGYEPARQRLFDGIAQRGVENVVVVTGDAHCSVASDLKLRFDDPEGSPTIGAEFLGTSISSAGDGADTDVRGQEFLASNPAMKFYNAQRGYQKQTLTTGSLVTDYKVVPYVTRPGAPVSTRASFTVLAGEPGIQEDRLT